MTEKNIKDAFAGESQANMKYLIFAEKAEKDGFQNVARLFRGVAYAEQIHAKNHFQRALKAVGNTSENLEAAYNGEDYEIEEMYPAFHAVAHLQEEKSALRTIHWALEAEKFHSDIYHRAKESVDQGNDFEMKDIHVCDVCGWTHEGEHAPDKCPLCGASADRFKKF